MSKDKTTTLFVGLDSDKHSISVAYAQEGCADPPVFVGPIGTRQADIDSLVRRLHPKARRFVARGPPRLADCAPRQPRPASPAPLSPARRSLSSSYNPILAQSIGEEHLSGELWPVSGPEHGIQDLDRFDVRPALPALFLEVPFGQSPKPLSAELMVEKLMQERLEDRVGNVDLAPLKVGRHRHEPLEYDLNICHSCAADGQIVAPALLL